MEQTALSLPVLATPHSLHTTTYPTAAGAFYSIFFSGGAASEFDSAEGLSYRTSI